MHLLHFFPVEHKQFAAGAEGHNQAQHNLVGMDRDLLGRTVGAAGDNSRFDQGGGLEEDNIDLVQDRYRSSLCWTW